MGLVAGLELRARPEQRLELELDLGLGLGMGLDSLQNWGLRRDLSRDGSSIWIWVWDWGWVGTGCRIGAHGVT